jgi:hypothetical protein
MSSNLADIPPGLCNTRRGFEQTGICVSACSDDITAVPAGVQVPDRTLVVAVGAQAIASIGVVHIGFTVLAGGEKQISVEVVLHGGERLVVAMDNNRLELRVAAG